MDTMYAEILNGVKVRMSRPKINHIKVTKNISRYLFDQFNDKYIILIEPNLYISEKDIFFPDLVICHEDIIKDDGVYGPPELVIEILSPSTHNNDKKYKFDKYFEFGVKEYWLIDPDSGYIDVYVDKKLWDTFRYVDNNTYLMFSDEQKQNVKTKVKSSIFPNLDLELEYVFYKVNINK